MNSSIGTLEHLRTERMQLHVADLAKRSPWYKTLFAKNGISANDIRTWADVSKLPFTTKSDLSDHNGSFRCVGMDRIVDHVFTSGSTGVPVPFLLSEKDLERLSRSEAASLASTGITDNDIVQITTTLDKRFMAGMAYWLGLRRLGAGIVRSGPGNTAGQWETAERCGATALITVPSFLLKMLQDRHALGQGDRATTITKAICIGEPITAPSGGPNVLGQRISELTDIALHGTYASTEMATACTERTPFGGHVVPEDMILIEVLDEHDRPVANGAFGEVVATPLGVEAMPLLRFRTGDICSSIRQVQPDGTDLHVLGSVIGRKEQRMKLKGTTLYPQQVIDAMNSAPGVRTFVVFREQDEHAHDVVRILLDTDVEDLDPIGNHVSDILRVKPILERADRTAIEKFRNDPRKRKPTPFIDLSKNQ